MTGARVGMRFPARLALAAACVVSVACGTPEEVPLPPPVPGSAWFESVFPRVLRPGQQTAATPQAIAAALPGSSLTAVPTGRTPPFAFGRELVTASGPCARYELLDERAEAALDSPRVLRATLAMLAAPLDFAAAQAQHGLRVFDAGLHHYLVSGSQVLVPGVRWRGQRVYYLLEQQQLLGVLAVHESLANYAFLTGRQTYSLHDLTYSEDRLKEFLPLHRDLPASCQRSSVIQAEVLFARRERAQEVAEQQRKAHPPPDLSQLRARLATSEQEYEAARARGDHLAALHAAMDGVRGAQDIQKQANPTDWDRYFSKTVALWVCRTYESRWELVSAQGIPADAPGRKALHEQLEHAVDDGHAYRWRFTISKPVVERVNATLLKFKQRLSTVLTKVILDQHAARRAEEERRAREEAIATTGGTSGSVGTDLSTVLQRCQATADFHQRRQALNDGKLPTHLR